MNASNTLRLWVCGGLQFQRDSQKLDLMDSSLTSDTLILFLEELLSVRDGIWRGKLIVTAVRTDHPTYDGPDGHSGGNAIDFSQAGIDDAMQHLVDDVRSCPHAAGIGVSGPWIPIGNAIGYGPQTKLFIDDPDPDDDHLHVQVVGY